MSGVDQENFVLGVQKFRFLFFFALVIIFYSGERGYIHILSRPPSARQQNAISIAFR